MATIRRKRQNTELELPQTTDAPPRKTARASELPALSFGMPPRLVMQRNELKQTWTEPVAVGEYSPAFDDPPEDDAPPPLPLDPIQAFIASLDNSQGYTLRVDRIPNFDKDGQAGVKVPKLFCRIYQFDMSEYLNLIANDYGEGTYWLTLRNQSTGVIVKSWTEHIAPRLNQPTQPASLFPSVLPAAQGAAPTSAMGMLKEWAAFARVIREINETMGIAQLGATAAPPAAPVVDVKDRLLTAFVDRAASRGDDATLDRILFALLGKEEPKEEKGFDFLATLERIAGPFIPAIAQAVMSQSRPGTQPVAQPPYTPPQWPAHIPPPPGGAAPVAPSPIGSMPIANQPAASTTAETDNTGDEEMTEENPFDTLLDNLVAEITTMSKLGIVETRNIEQGAALIRQFIFQYPNASDSVRSLLRLPAPSVLLMLEGYHSDFAGISTVPLATEYVEALQRELMRGPL